MQPISEYLFKYLEKKIPEFSKIKKFGQNLFTCPKMHNHKFKSQTPTATFLPNSDKINCLICGFKGTTYDVVRALEEDKKNWSDAQVTEYLISALDLDLYKEFDVYVKYGWSLVVLLKNSNKPFEGDWRSKDYFDKVKWIKWLNNRLNIGLNCEKSGVTAVDVDCKHPVKTEEAKQLREEIIELCKKENTLAANTPSGGNHYVFQWEEELRKQVVNGCGTQIDTRTVGQIAIAPSIMDNKPYVWQNLGTEIKKMSPELKSKLLLFQSVEKGRTEETVNDNSDAIIDEGEKPKLINNDLSGCRNAAFTQLGGLLTKLNITQDKRATILYWLNRNWLENPRGTEEIKATLGSLAGYEESDEKTHEQAIFEFLKVMQSDVTPNDVIKSVFNNDHTKSALAYKYLSKLVKDGRAIRIGYAKYQYREKVEWDDSIPSPIQEINFKIPIFSDYAKFIEGELILLGFRTNHGKSTVAMNLMADFIKQNIKPHYIISAEGDKRWQIPSDILGITGKFFRYYHPNPLQIELPYNGVTIIDWLRLMQDPTQVETIFKHLNDELQRRGGTLIVFAQLKDNDNYEWIAPNQCKTIPSFAARYFQDNQNHTEGHFQCDKVKEPRGSNMDYTIQCVYDKTTRIFKPKNLI